MLFRDLDPSSAPEALYRRVHMARNILPILIVLVVVVYQLSIFKLDQHLNSFPFWASLLFYGLVGPAVTFFTLQWIMLGIQVRQKAEVELRSLYDELSRSHKRLDTVQQLLRQLAEASDIEAVMDTALPGIVRSSAAHSGLMILEAGLVRSIDVGGNLSNTLSEWTTLPALEQTNYAEGYWQIGLALRGGGQSIGRLYLRYPEEPSQEICSLLYALSSEVGNALEATGRRSRDLFTLYEVDQSIRAERNMDRLLERMLQQMAQRSQAAGQAAYLVDPDGVLRLVWAQDLTGHIWHGGVVSDFVKQVAYQRMPLLVHHCQEEGPLLGAQSLMGLPMLLENDLRGVLVLAFDQMVSSERSRLPLLALMANQATLAIRNAQAYLYSEELAIGEERNRIAREIHDGVAQSLAFTALKLDLTERLLDRDLPKARQEIVTAKQILREQIKEVRRSIFALRPIDLERFGLVETVRKYVQDFGEQNNIKTYFQLDGDIHLPPSDEAMLFRIVQESLNNIAKHARAQQVWVALSTDTKMVSLRIRDDGQGFNLESAENRVSTVGGLGLRQMRERIENRGGVYHIESELGLGTTVYAELAAS